MVETQHLSKKNLAHKCTSGWREGDDTEALKRFSCNPRLRILPWELARNFEFRTIPANQFPEAYFIPRNKNDTLILFLVFCVENSFFKETGESETALILPEKAPPLLRQLFLQLPVFPNISFFFFFWATDPKGLPLDASTKGARSC